MWMAINGGPSVIKDLTTSLREAAQIKIAYFGSLQERCCCDLRDLPSLQVERAEVEIEFGLRKYVADDIV